jgi:bacterioferritin
MPATDAPLGTPGVPDPEALAGFDRSPDGAKRNPGLSCRAAFQGSEPGLGRTRFADRQERTAMKGDSRVIDYLNKGLRHELTAVNQYWLHYRLLDNWGYKALAKQWRKESIEEMQHADKLTTRIIFLDGFPNMQVIDPLHIGQTVKEVLDSDLGAELSARELYQEASTYCHSVKDYVSRDLFEQLMADEEDHIDFLETQLDLVAKLGLELYAQHHIGEPDEDE